MSGNLWRISLKSFLYLLLRNYHASYHNVESDDVSDDGDDGNNNGGKGNDNGDNDDDGFDNDDNDGDNNDDDGDNDDVIGPCEQHLWEHSSLDQLFHLVHHH